MFFARPVETSWGAVFSGGQRIRRIFCPAYAMGHFSTELGGLPAASSLWGGGVILPDGRAGAEVSHVLTELGGLPVASSFLGPRNNNKKN